MIGFFYFATLLDKYTLTKYLNLLTIDSNQPDSNGGDKVNGSAVSKNLNLSSVDDLDTNPEDHQRNQADNSFVHSLQLLSCGFPFHSLRLEKVNQGEKIVPARQFEQRCSHRLDVRPIVS